VIEHRLGHRQRDEKRGRELHGRNVTRASDALPHPPKRGSHARS
jgi:hypothetical protein